MLRAALFVIHALELGLYTWLFHNFDVDGPVDWLIDVLGAALLVRLLIIVLTFVIARTPLRPWSLSLAVLAAEYYAAVNLFSYGALRKPTVLVAPTKSDPHHLPILFIHGFSCNAGFWHAFIRHFGQHWGQWLATINLEPIRGPIDEYAPSIEQRIDELLAASGQTKCLVVAHSMGGLATRHVLRSAQARRKIAGVVTLGTPHSGTLLAHFSLAKNAHQMRRFNDWLTTLSEDESQYDLPPFEALMGTHDNIVAPQECARFEPAINTTMTGVSHLAMAFNDNVIDWTLQRCARLAVKQLALTQKESHD